MAWPRAALAIALACAMAGANAVPLRADELEVINGDTLVLAGSPIRLLGIEAPERGAFCRRAGQRYPCGEEAARVLLQLLAGAEVRCDGLEGPRFGEVIVASCKADGRDLAGELVRLGWARADRRYASRYEHDEAEARAAKRGLWAGTPPWP
ncbi:MAG: thermonuclease family protein [Kiloniellales bacterium]